jgi:hypothetical protein
MVTVPTSYGTHSEDGLRVGNYFDTYYMSITDSFGTNSAPGVFLTPVTSYIITPVAASANSIATAQIANGAVTLTSSTVTLDVARALVITGNANTTSVAFTINGTDIIGRPVTETVTGPAGANTATSVKCFKTITGISTTATSTTNITIGTADIFGLPLACSYFDTLINAKWNQVDLTTATFTGADATSPATATTGDTRGKITAPNASDGVKRLVVTFRVEGASVPYDVQTLQGYNGVSQYSGS